MSRKLEFFYDYVSAYSYLANSQLHKLDAEIVYRPMLLGAVMKATGNRPPGLVAAKGDYIAIDIARWSKHYAIPYVMNPEFPQNTVKALRLAIVAEQQGVFSQLHQPLFDAIWAQQQDLGNDSVLQQILSTANLPAEQMLADIATDDIKNELKKNTAEAVRRGVFGAPTFFLGDEMFFGNDRFDFIRTALEK